MVTSTSGLYAVYTVNGSAFNSPTWPPPYDFTDTSTVEAAANRARFFTDNPLWTRTEVAYLQWRPTIDFTDTDPTGWQVRSATLAVNLNGLVDDSDGFNLEGYWYGPDLPTLPGDYQTAPSGPLAFSLPLASLSNGSQAITLGSTNAIDTSAGGSVVLAIWVYKGGTAPRGLGDGLEHRNAVALAFSPSTIILTLTKGQVGQPGGFGDQLSGLSAPAYDVATTATSAANLAGALAENTSQPALTLEAEIPYHRQRDIREGDVIRIIAPLTAIPGSPQSGYYRIMDREWSSVSPHVKVKLLYIQPIKESNAAHRVRHPVPLLNTGLRGSGDELRALQFLLQRDGTLTQVDGRSQFATEQFDVAWRRMHGIESRLNTLESS